MIKTELITWNDYGIKNAKRAIRAIDHPLRRKLIAFIDHQGTMSVTELYIKMRMDQSVVSQHIAILRRAGILTGARYGKNVNYSIDYERVEQIQLAIDAFGV